MNELQIKQNILKIRESLRITQDEMARMMGMSRQTYINFEHGNTILINKWLLRMSEVTGVDLSVFILGFDHKERSISQLKDIESYGEKLGLMQEKYEMLQMLMNEKDRALQDQRSFNSYLIGLHPKND